MEVAMAAKRKKEKHPTHVEGFDGTLEELAQKIYRMRYDKVAEFCAHARDELRRQAARDRELNHPILAGRLSSRAVGMNTERRGFESIWRLCEPHMK